ncbi:hypothetical protein C1H46_040951 [Malus baccata]|uniref:Uncharacterized protein n=1 Tax=Malus baccata TaxID=106549 RepID=A0A540KH38_MALBA|nr:hypothetical protein C1H46_040951 [Malus baccata]
MIIHKGGNSRRDAKVVRPIIRGSVPSTPQGRARRLTRVGPGNIAIGLEQTSLQFRVLLREWKNS